MAALEKADGSDDKEKGDDQSCGICHDVACDPLVTNKCCNQIFCSKCLKEYLEHIQDDHTMPCPYCKMEQFTYMPLSMKVCYL